MIFFWKNYNMQHNSQIKRLLNEIRLALDPNYSIKMDTHIDYGSNLNSFYEY